METTQMRKWTKVAREEFNKKVKYTFDELSDMMDFLKSYGFVERPCGIDSYFSEELNMFCETSYVKKADGYDYWAVDYSTPEELPDSVARYDNFCEAAVVLKHYGYTDVAEMVDVINHAIASKSSNKTKTVDLQCTLSYEYSPEFDGKMSWEIKNPTEG